MFSVITRDRQSRGPGLIFIEEYFIGHRGDLGVVSTAIIRGVTGIVCLLSKCFCDLNGTHGRHGDKGCLLIRASYRAHMFTHVRVLFTADH